MTDALFDADDYGKSTQRPPQPTIDTVAVMSDATWKLVSARQHGVVHALAGTRTTDKKGNRVGIAALVTFCGIVAVPRTFAPGEVVRGCKACIDRGAPVANKQQRGNS